MSKFIINGAMVTVSEDAAMDVRDRLPTKTYVVEFSPNIGYYLKEMDPMTVPSRVYGRLPNYQKRIMTTFLERPVNTGVLLVGDKGSGKTMLARGLSVLGLTMEVPTIVVNSPWKGDMFNKFMQNINTPCVVLLDEFEKVYDEMDQEAVLTLLDGVFTSKKMFILTCNDPYRIDSHMRNRPGRLFYNIKFNGLDEEAIREYCAENMQDEKKAEYTDLIVKMSAAFDSFNFDMLKALVEEMNRYKESPKDAVRIMNILPENAGGHSYKIGISYKGQQIDEDLILDSIWDGSVLMYPEITVRFFEETGKMITKKIPRVRRVRSSIEDTMAALGTPVSGGETPYDEKEEMIPERNVIETKIITSKPLSMISGVLVYQPNADTVVSFTPQTRSAFNFDAF